MMVRLRQGSVVRELSEMRAVFKPTRCGCVACVRLRPAANDYLLMRLGVYAINWPSDERFIELLKQSGWIMLYVS